ncbi:hypothetical protein L6R29_22310 [Myxococcota bacterium]|nr:hypothetical protein [Myxococcota bacterium]
MRYIHTTADECFRILRWLGFCAALTGMLFAAPCVWANASDFQKAVEHYKNFEIRDALPIFERLAGSSSGTEKARALLYVGLCHAYLRDRDKAIDSMKQAIKVDNNVALPPQTPARLSELFREARSQSGLGGDPPVARREAPPERRDPPEKRQDEPAPEKRQDEPPPKRRKISFGGFDFSVRRRPPPERRVEEPAPERRRSEEPAPERRRSEEPVPERRVEEPVPERRVEEPEKRKVSPRDPILPDGDKDPLTDTPDPSKKPKSGPNLMLILGGVSAGLAAALVGGAIFMGLRANSTLAIGKKPETYQVDLPKIQADAGSAALVANLLYGGAGLFAAGAVVFFILSPGFGAKKPAKSAMHLGPFPTHAQTKTGQAHLLFSSGL